MSGTRCETSDLLVDQCAHCTGAALDDPKPIRTEGRETEARWPGNCACCGTRYPAGTTIVLADINGDGVDQWCLPEHTRSA